ncbi:MAG: TonB-dependent receptor [Bacteroidota bacterium]|nr:TonB-dependent receptor [Bacteroidota bacterium]
MEKKSRKIYLPIHLSLKKSVLFLLCLFFLGLKLTAQTKPCTKTLRGKVIDTNDSMPLNHCHIEITHLKKSTFTNQRGEFMLQNICDDSIELHVSHLQCEHLHLEIKFFHDTFITIYIQHTEIDIQGAKISVEAKKEIASIGKKQLENLKGQSISEMMTELSGVQLLRNGTTIAKPVVNGLHSNRVILINNEIRQEGQNWGLDHAPEIDGNWAHEIQLIKGADALRYASDGIGGVIIVKPHTIFREKTNIINGERNYILSRNGRGGATTGFLGNKISNKIPLYWRFYGTASESGNIKTPNYFLDNTGKIETNYAIHLGYQIKRLKTELLFSHFKNKIGIFTGAHIGNLTDLQNAINTNRPIIESDFSYRINRPYQWVTHDLVKFKNEYIVNSKNTLELILSYQNNNRQEYDIIRSGNASKSPSFDYYIKTTMADLLWTRTDFHRLNFKFGGFALHQRNAFAGRFVIPGFIQNGGAAYFITSSNFNGFKFESGLRYDIKHLQTYLWQLNILNVDERTFNNFTYHVQIKKNTGKHSSITLAHNSSWRPPAPNELFSNGLHQGLASIEIGNPNLKPERAFNNLINFQHKGHRSTFETEIFYKHIFNFINLVPDNEPVLTIRGAYPVFRFEQYRAEIFGINYLYKYQFNKNYFIQNTANIAFGNNLESNQPLNQFVPINSKLSVGFQKNKITFVPNIQYTFTQFRYVLNSDLKAPPKGFFLIGAQFNYEFKFRKQTVNFNITFQNLSNQIYREYLNRMRYFTDEAGYNIIAKLNIPLNINLKNNRKNEIKPN